MKLFTATLLIHLIAVQCEEYINVHDKMYAQLTATSPCVLRLNGTQTFGCTSARNGNVGVIHLVRNTTELQQVLSAQTGNKYMPVLTTDMFTMETLMKLNSSANVNGILLVQKKKREEISSFSTEDTCPNRYSGLAGPPVNADVCPASSTWNPLGSSIMLRRWNMPIFFTNDNETIGQIEKCFYKFNPPLDDEQGDRSLCALEMSAHMYAAVDSVTCLRRNDIAYNLNRILYCAPLGDKSVYSPIVPFRTFDMSRKRSFFVVAARLDSTSLFYERAPGALSTVTSLVTLLMTAKLLYRLANETSYEKNVLFVLFNGEAYDYIGSSRVVYDMEQGEFPYKEKPMSKEHIDMFVELSQLSNTPDIVYHTNANNPSTRDFATMFAATASELGWQVKPRPSDNPRTPPSSAQSFLVADSNLSAVVMSSYDMSFTNPFYHSMYDDAYNIQYKYSNKSDVPEDSIQAYIANFSTTLAYTLLKKMKGGSAPIGLLRNAKEDADELLHCYVDTRSCDYLKDLFADTSFPDDGMLNYYVSDNTTGSQYKMTIVSQYLMVYFMNTTVNGVGEEECAAKGSGYYWVSDKHVCIKSEVNVTSALSPAFIIENYDMSSGRYSTWTESSANLISVRMFVKPSDKHEWLVGICGFVSFVFSFLSIYWINKRAKELFNYPHLITASNI